MSDYVWLARDADGAECALERTHEAGRWQITIDGAYASGYPTVDLDLSDLINLRDALNEEIVA